MFLILSSSEDNEYTTSKKTVGTEGSEVMDMEITQKPRGIKKVVVRNQVGEKASDKKEAWSREKGRQLAAGSLSRNRDRNLRKEESCERQTRASVVFYMIFPFSLKLG